MLNFYPIINWVRAHGTQILTTLGCVGVVGVAVSSAAAGAKTENDILELKKQNPEISRGEILKKEAKNFIAPALFTAGTIGCIIGSEKTAQAQLSAALGLASSIDIYNKRKQMAKPGFDPDQVTLFYDSISQEFFTSTVDEVLKAESDFNRDYIYRSYAVLNDFYDYVNLPHTEYGDTNGWSCYSYVAAGNDDYTWIHFDHILRHLDDGTPYYEIVFPFEPYPTYLDWV